MASQNVALDKICVLHPINKVAVQEKDKIILFKDNTLKSCKEAEIVHKLRPNWSTSVHRNVILPSVPDNFQGYHSKCYSNYTSVSKADKEAAAAQLQLQSVPTTTSTSGNNFKEKLFLLH